MFIFATDSSLIRPAYYFDCSGFSRIDFKLNRFEVSIGHELTPFFPELFRRKQVPFPSFMVASKLPVETLSSGNLLPIPRGAFLAFVDFSSISPCQLGRLPGFLKVSQPFFPCLPFDLFFNSLFLFLIFQARPGFFDYLKPTNSPYNPQES